jgi:ribonuclease HI
MDRGMGRSPAITTSASPAPGVASRTAPPKPPQPRQVLEGFVKNGVVHLINGELPDGIFVKILRE